MQNKMSAEMKFWFVLTLVVLGLFFSLGAYRMYLDNQEKALIPPVVEVSEIPTPPAVTALPSTEVEKPQPALGTQAIAKISIPKLGKAWNVNQGTREQDFDGADVGHFEGTAMPGGLGNFAVVGHRSKKVFLDVDRLAAKDVIQVSYNGAVYTYSVFKRYTVSPQDVYVISPDPGNWGQGGKYLTLVTCVRSGSHAREIIHAQLVEG